ncbi:UNVERIFIED_CONTAM: hypothetical protein Scaly_2866000 [Sesamum calycinum]|uniref:Reverse transcriptase/retrotransposon-derived protein RNase H-like domain-containing protein n=1 Tax=Sesamum calycinum TaxID=2727403 RepID=A0AAW2LHK7_9LAMI
MMFLLLYENQVSQGRGRSKVVTPILGVPEEPLSGGDHSGPNQKPEHTNLDRRADQQGLHPKDLDEQIQDPEEEPLRGELSDEPIPEPMKVSKTVIAGHVEQKHSDLFLRKEYIEIPRIFKEFAKVMAPDPIRISKIGGVDIVIKDHLVLDRTLSSRIEFSSMMSFSEDRIMGYNEKEKELLKALTPQEIRLVVSRYEGMLEIAGHEILVAGAGRENGSMTLGLSFIEDQKPWGRKAYSDLGLGICTAKFGGFPKEDKRKFGKVLLSFRQQGLIDSDRFYEESDKEIKNLKEAFEDLLVWWDKNKIEATLKSKKNANISMSDISLSRLNIEDKKNMRMIIKENINLELIEPGIFAYSSPGFLVRNHGEIKRGKPRYCEHIVEKIRNFPDVLKDKKHLQSFLGVVNFASMFIKDLARVRELKQICIILPKLAIPQDDDELVVYTDANDYRWAAVLMKRTTTGEEPCRYTGGLFSEQ